MGGEREERFENLRSKSFGFHGFASQPCSSSGKLLEHIVLERIFPTKISGNCLQMINNGMVHGQTKNLGCYSELRANYRQRPVKV